MKYNFSKKPVCLLLGCLLFALPFHLAAQATLNAEDVKTQFIKDWQRAKAYTLDYLNTMPPEKYSLKAVDSIRSFAQQMLHLASSTVFLISSGTGQVRIFNNRNLETSASAQSRDSVLYYVSASYDYAIKGIQDLDASKLGELIGTGNRSVPRYVWILKAFEHQTHHRGQTTIYIRLAGIRPPNEQLF